MLLSKAEETGEPSVGLINTLAHYMRRTESPLFAPALKDTASHNGDAGSLACSKGYLSVLARQLTPSALREDEETAFCIIALIGILSC